MNTFNSGNLNIKKFLILSLTVLLCTSCNTVVDDEEDYVIADNAIKIGVLAPLTGFLGEVGFWMEVNAKLAQKQINEQGGLLEQPVEVIVKNTHFPDMDAAIKATEELINEGVVAIVGPLTSSETIAIAPTVANANVLLLTGTASSGEITDLEDNDTIFRTTASGDIGATRIAEVMNSDGHNTLSVVYINDTNGQTKKNRVVETFAGTVITEVSIEADQNSYTEKVSALFANGIPEAVLLITFSLDGATLTRDMAAFFNANNITQFPAYYGTGELIDPAFLNNANPTLAEGLKSTNGGAPSEELTYLDDIFNDEMREILGDDAEPINVIYDLFWVISYTILEADRLGQAISRQSVLNNIRSTTNTDDTAAETVNVRVNELEKVRTALAEGKDISIFTSSGDIILDENGDRREGGFVILQAQLVADELTYVEIN